MDLVRIVIYLSMFIGLFTSAYYLLNFLQKTKSKKKDIGEPFFSIIVPAYNEQKGIAKTIDSLLALDYPKSKMEIIVVNDGSKDNTQKIAERYASKYKFIKVINKKNGGKASAMNEGIKVARGEFIVSFDADSMVRPDGIRNALPYFADNEVVCVTPGMKLYKPKGILQRVQAIEYDLGIFLRKTFSKVDAIHVTPGPFSIYRKWFFDKHGGYEVGNITEDMEIAMRIQSLNYRIENSPNTLVYTIAPNKFFPLLRQRRRWYFGLIKNLIKYKFIFGRKYGEFGLIIFPMAAFSILTTMLITFYYIYKSISDNVKQAILYSSIGFDYIHNVSYEWYGVYMWFYRFIAENIMLFGIFFLISTLCILIISNRKVRGDRPIPTFISYMFFMIFYSLLFTFWWVVSIMYALTHKEVKW